MAYNFHSPVLFEAVIYPTNIDAFPYSLAARKGQMTIWQKVFRGFWEHLCFLAILPSLTIYEANDEASCNHEAISTRMKLTY